MRTLLSGPRLFVALLAAAPFALGAQTFEASVSTFMVQSNILFTNTRAEQTGQWFSAEGAVRFGKLRASMASAMGSLGGDSSLVNPDRDGRSTILTAQLQATSWLAVGPTAEARRFDSDAGIVVWRLIGLNAYMTPAVVSNVLTGLIDVSFWPAATIVEGDKMGLAFRTIAGATYHLAGGKAGIRLAYRFERFDFDSQGAAARLEQFRGATLGAVFRFSR